MSDWCNHIYRADSRRMSFIPDESTDLVFTSPMYLNAGIKYDGVTDNMPLNDYLHLHGAVWLKCYRVLKPGGRICVVVANIGRKPYVRLDAMHAELLRQVGFEDRGTIIWDKGACLSGNTKVCVRDPQRGLVTCKELVDLHANGSWRGVEIEAIDTEGCPLWLPIVNLWRAGGAKGVTIKFTDGSSVTATNDHRFVRPDGSLVFAKDVQLGDRLKRSPRTPAYEGHVPAAFSLLDLAWALGLYLAEGSNGGQLKWGVDSIRYHLHADETPWIDRIERAWKPFGCTVHARRGDGNRLIVTVSGRFAYEVVRYFVFGTTSHNKIPTNNVLRAHLEWRNAFLMGWLAGDGHFEEAHARWSGSITGKNRRLMGVLRCLARSVGLRLQHNTGWATSESGGKQHPIVKWKLYLRQSTYRTAEPWDSLKVAEITPQTATFYDLSLPTEPHLFILANGLISHNSVASSTAWGSWLRPTAPQLRDRHEYILVFQKPGKKVSQGHGDMTAEEFTAATQSIWDIRPAHASKVGHPAPFPVELAERAIRLYTYPGDVVLDPFNGSGATCQAAQRTGRLWVGVDVVQAYCALAAMKLGCDVVDVLGVTECAD